MKKDFKKKFTPNKKRSLPRDDDNHGNDNDSDSNSPSNKRQMNKPDNSNDNNNSNNNNSNDDDDDDSDGDSSSHKTTDKGREVIVILDRATLEIVKTKKGEFQLLNCDDHVSLMKKFNKDPSAYRPDIVHQELMAVLDSPLNKAGLVKVYVHTEKNVLVEINPKTRIPRTFKRFSGLMVQLLHKLKIRSADGSDMLLKVIKNPISRHLPPGAVCFGFSQKGNLYSPTSLANKLPDSQPIILVLGAMATGSINTADHPYISELISISNYPLSGVVAVNRVLGAIEHRWGII